nr:MAG TPA: 7-carboxy-7-deazaguanine synthase [Caudoviricetes sp.]
MKTIPIVPFEGPFITNNFNNRLDVELILFSQCNLHCKHCKVKGLNNVFDKKLIIQQGEWAVQAIKSARYKCKHVEVHITGGELFQDHLDWSVYEEVIGKIETALKNTKRTYTIGLTSNLTTHRIEDVITMFKKHSNWELSTSFDFAGRFSSDDLDTWVSNILALHDHGIRLLPISIVQHLPSLKAIKKGSSKTQSF